MYGHIEMVYDFLPPMVNSHYDWKLFWSSTSTSRNICPSILIAVDPPNTAFSVCPIYWCECNKGLHL